MPSRHNSGSSAAPSRFSPFRQAFTFQLSLVSLLGICLVALIGAGWIFAFGVIIGRGFEPDEKLPVLGRLATPGGDASPDGPGGIIKAEDLTFHSELKTQPTLSTEPASSSARSQESRPADPKKPERAATAAGQAAGQTSRQAAGQAAGQASRQTSGQASGQAAGQTAGQPQRQAQRQATQTPGATILTPRYNYVLQVIAYKKVDQAEAFRAKLENDGLRTRLQIEKDKEGNPRIYHVQVLLTKATDADVEQTRAAVSRHGAKAPTVVSRKPI
jgi:hypothetical protein